MTMTIFKWPQKKSNDDLKININDDTKCEMMIKN